MAEAVEAAPVAVRGMAVQAVRPERRQGRRPEIARPTASSTTTLARPQLVATDARPVRCQEAASLRAAALGHRRLRLIAAPAVVRHRVKRRRLHGAVKGLAPPWRGLLLFVLGASVSFFIAQDAAAR